MLQPTLMKDGYKVGHKFQYPPKTSLVYSNMTPRASRVPGVDSVVVFGVQYFVIEYLINKFQMDFFAKPKDRVLARYKRIIDAYLGKDAITVDHIGALHDLGYLPLRIKSLPEGTLCPMRVPFLTVRNTKPEFFWLTNMIETMMSNALWMPVTSATTAFGYRKRFEKYAALTGSNREFVKWQGHDFSYRGLPGYEAACLSGAAHLLSFYGTDTIPAIDFLEAYYGANVERELVAGSVPATEHSVMCMGLKAGEFETFKRLITDVYPKGIVSIVSDTWDFWQVLTDYLPRLKREIMARDGKVVIRPDSGDPVKIICGDPDAQDNVWASFGAVETLWVLFGGKVNEAGYKELDPHIGLIYGDSITPERQKEILERLAAKGFASSNVVLGIGSYTYQYVTRDTFGLAVKATYGEIDGIGQSISKDPKTDNGVKKSASGLLQVYRGADGNLAVRENCTWAEELSGELTNIFVDGELTVFYTLEEIRARIEAQL